MGKKVEINLLASPKMSKQEENDCIRLSRRAREHLGLTTQSIRLGRGDNQVQLRVRQAYREDIQALARKLQKGAMSEEEALAVAFVSSHVRRMVAPGGEITIWTTTGIGNITIGCDPEFGLIDQKSNMLVRGDALLPNSKKSPFGEDGPGVEVRPLPSRDHLKLVANIHKVLQNAPAPTANYLWRGGATYTDAARTYWFGGHIHLGRPDFIRPEHAEQCFEYVARILDHMLALPLVTFDKPDPHLRRNGCSLKYGKAGDIRLKGEGSQVRFEYRVPSGLWLTHPVLARIVLGSAKGIAEAVYSQLSKSSPDEFCDPGKRVGLAHKLGVSQVRQVASIINNAEVKGLEPELFNLWETQIKDLETYDEYAPEMNALIELVKASPESVVPNLELDIRKGWEEGKSLLPKAKGNLKSAIEAVEFAQ